MRRRLEDLNWQTQPRSLNNARHEDVVRVLDPTLSEAVARPPISLKAHHKKKKKKIA